MKFIYKQKIERSWFCKWSFFYHTHTYVPLHHGYTQDQDQQPWQQLSKEGKTNLESEYLADGGMF